MRLGFAFPEGAGQAPHAEAELPGGIRLLLDTEESVRSFTPGWEPMRPGAGGTRSPCCATRPRRWTPSTRS